MIKSFKCSETEKIWIGVGSRRLPSNIQNVARRKLRMINNAKILNDLKQLDNHLKEVGCPDLQEFLTSLVPNKDDDWVIIPKNEHKKSWFSYIKTGVYNGYYVGKKLSEVRGVAVGTISTTIWLLKSPAGKAVVKALIALVI